MTLRKNLARIVYGLWEEGRKMETTCQYPLPAIDPQNCLHRFIQKEGRPVCQDCGLTSYPVPKVTEEMIFAPKKPKAPKKLTPKEHLDAVIGSLMIGPNGGGRTTDEVMMLTINDILKEVTNDPA